MEELSLSGEQPLAAQAAPRRTIALCVSQWNHPSTFYAWQWMRQYLLRRRGAEGEDGLHPSDNLLIVRVGKHVDDDPRWKVGGPLIADVDTALRNYPHQILKLQGSIQARMRQLIEEYAIDVVVLGDDFPQSGFKITSVTDWVKEKVTCPFIIIRPEAVRNKKMRLSSAKEPLSPKADAEAAAAGGGAEPAGARARGTSPPPPTEREGRKVCIAYERFDVGQHLMEKAKAVALEPDDTVYVAHCFPSGGGGGAPQWLQHPTQMFRQAGKQAGKLARAMTFQRAGSAEGGENAEVTPDNSIDFGAKELEDYRVVLNVVLRGDPRSALERFSESEGIDLLVIGTRTGGKLRKTLTGGSVSGYLIDKAPCPCLVIPYKAMGMGAEASMSGGEEEEEGVRGLSPRAGSAKAFNFHPGAHASPHGVDAAVQTESTVLSPQAASVAQHLEVGGGLMPAAAAACEPSASGGEPVHSTPSDMLAVLQQQLEEKDRVIAELRAELQRLRLAQAQRKDSETHDFTNAPASY